jgi:hypothetical protein
METSLDKRILRLERVVLLFARPLEAPQATGHWEELNALLEEIRADVKARMG